MKLNLGCGPDVRAGWVNVDVVDYGQPFVCDVRDGLPFDDAHFEVAVANHVLQMFSWGELVPVLREVRRVLRPGGLARLIVPDLLGAVHAYEDDAADWFPIDDTFEPDIDGKLCMYVSQAGATRSVFTSGWLRSLCTRAGFPRAWTLPWGSTMWEDTSSLELDAREHESIVVEAIR